MDVLYQGALGPETYVATCTQDDTGVDMTTVAAGAFIVEKPDGTIATWPGVISGAVTTQLVLTYTFNATTSDIDIAGTYRIFAELTVPSGTRTTERINEYVRARFETAS